MSQTTKVEDKVLPATAEDFAKKFEKLVKETGFTLVPSLTWVARDDGTWSTKVNMTVGQILTERKNK